MKTTDANRPIQPAAHDERTARLMRVLTLLASRPEKAVRQTSASRGGVNDGAEAQVLVVEFDDAYTTFVEGFERLPGESQMIALQAVDTKLSAMVDAKDATLWTDRARREDQIWAELRELAADVVAKFAGPEREPETAPGMSSQPA